MHFRIYPLSLKKAMTLPSMQSAPTSEATPPMILSQSVSA